MIDVTLLKSINSVSVPKNNDRNEGGNNLKV